MWLFQSLQNLAADAFRRFRDLRDRRPEPAQGIELGIVTNKPGWLTEAV